MGAGVPRFSQRYVGFRARFSIIFHKGKRQDLLWLRSPKITEKCLPSGWSGPLCMSLTRLTLVSLIYIYIYICFFFNLFVYLCLLLLFYYVYVLFVVFLCMSPAALPLSATAARNTEICLGNFASYCYNNYYYYY